MRSFSAPVALASASGSWAHPACEQTSVATPIAARPSAKRFMVILLVDVLFPRNPKGVMPAKAGIGRGGPCGRPDDGGAAEGAHKGRPYRSRLRGDDTWFAP